MYPTHHRPIRIDNDDTESDPLATRLSSGEDTVEVEDLSVRSLSESDTIPDSL
jgi:hypothetical protein